MDQKLCVGILFGGRSGEHEVSLMSARSVLSVLDPQKYTIVPIGITHEGQWLVGENVLDALSAGNTQNLLPAVLIPVPGENTLYVRLEEDGRQVLKPYAHLDIIFPVLHGSMGEDGAPQGLFEMAEMAYVGAGVLGSAVGMDKALFKDVMRANGIPVIESIVVTRGQIQREMEQVLAAAEKMAPYPLFTKPANLGSSVGITKCRSRSDLFEGLMDAARFDRRVLIERGLEAPREIEISVLGNDEPVASVPGEIRPSDDFYSYAAKYIDGRSALFIPAELPAETAERVRSYAVTAYRAADCSGMARADFFLEPGTGQVYLSEINTIPGFTQISMYPKLWEASGLSYTALIDRLIELGLERKAQRDHTERRYRRDE